MSNNDWALLDYIQKFETLITMDESTDERRDFVTNYILYLAAALRTDFGDENCKYLGRILVVDDNNYNLSSTKMQ